MMLPKPGTYTLIFSSSIEKKIEIGKLGTLNVMPGWYAYVGSGRGPGGVRARVAHHQGTSCRPRWHLDYLRPYLCLTHIWYTVDTAPWECEWARVLSQSRGAVIPLLRFGASDCRCPAHLFYFKTAPSFPTFKKRIRFIFQGHPKLYRYQPSP